MPRLNGYAACVQIRQNPKAQYAAILVVTGHGELEDRTEAYQVGADDLLLKPVSRLELISRVRALLRMREYKITTDRYQGAIAAALGETANIVQAIEAKRAGLGQLPRISAVPHLDTAVAACRRLEQQLSRLQRPDGPEPAASR